MNNLEANAVIVTKEGEMRLIQSNLQLTIQFLLEYENEMNNWKTDVVVAKIAEIKSYATAAGIDLSTWDGSEAPIEEEDEG